MNIGEKLRIARTRIGYTLETAASLAGISVTALSDLENSKREPKFSRLSSIAEIYRKPIDFFLSEQLAPPEILLWRAQPDSEEERKQTESQFRQLCHQYRRLEILMNEVKEPDLPKPDIPKDKEFNYSIARFFAHKVQKAFPLDDIPIRSLKKTLEESYYVKIFYLDFSGSSIATVSEEFGPAILLNSRNKQWRRSYDLAHELFHILTWTVFRTKEPYSINPSEDEEKLANAFASALLMPQEPLEQKVRLRINEQGKISLDQLDDIAREYDVSLEALIYRIAGIFMFNAEKVESYRKAASEYMRCISPRQSYKPDKFPERYYQLAQRALREGRLSLMQFAKYMDISYKKAQEYLTEDEDFTDEKISIPVA